MVPPDEWARWPDEKLMDLRMSQLGVTIEGSPLEARIGELQAELDARGLAFQPHFWLSAEWFSPDGVPGVAIPFYLAHPRLEKLERTQMLEVEGGTPEWCMKILRHEAGHAIDNAYKLRQRRRRQQVFGPSYMHYPEYYTPKPYSKSFVLHLDSWYAQSHPDEDFAESFAVWLNPQADWRNRYADWPALKKLEYMDALMRELAGKPALVRTRRKVEPLQNLRKTLRAHYERKRRHYGVEHPHFYDRDLRKLFSDAPRAREQHEGGAIHRPRPPRRAAHGRVMDRRIPIHDRPGHREHDPPHQRAEPPAPRPRGAEQGRLHRHADRADDELPAQRVPSRGAVGRRRLRAQGKTALGFWL